MPNKLASVATGPYSLDLVSSFLLDDKRVKLKRGDVEEDEDEYRTSLCENID